MNYTIYLLLGNHPVPLYGEPVYNELDTALSRARYLLEDKGILVFYSDWLRYSVIRRDNYPILLIIPRNKGMRKIRRLAKIYSADT